MARTGGKLITPGNWGRQILLFEYAVSICQVINNMASIASHLFLPNCFPQAFLLLIRFISPCIPIHFSSDLSVVFAFFILVSSFFF